MLRWRNRKEKEYEENKKSNPGTCPCVQLCGTAPGRR